ncbi:MAG: hypothetical protein AB1830_13385 [Pseudomonadota bacterium]
MPRRSAWSVPYRASGKAAKRLAILPVLPANAHGGLYARLYSIRFGGVLEASGA